MEGKQFHLPRLMGRKKETRRGKSQDVERRRTSKHEGMFWMILSKVAQLLRKVEGAAFQ